MCQLIENIAHEKGINIEDANYIFSTISEYFIQKIPAFSQVFKDVYDDKDESILQGDINSAIQLIQQQQWQEKFKNCVEYPEENSIKRNRGGELF